MVFNHEPEIFECFNRKIYWKITVSSPSIRMINSVYFFKRTEQMGEWGETKMSPVPLKSVVNWDKGRDVLWNSFVSPPLMPPLPSMLHSLQLFTPPQWTDKIAIGREIYTIHRFSSLPPPLTPSPAWLAVHLLRYMGRGKPSPKLQGPFPPP